MINDWVYGFMPVQSHKQLLGAGSLGAIARAIADDVLPFHYLVFSPDKTNQSAR